MTVHTALPDALTVAADEVLAGAGVRHVAHGDGDPVAAGVAAAEDSSALALIGPYRSRGVAEAVEATAPFDDHGDPVDPPVWLWHARDDWTLQPDRAI